MGTAGLTLYRALTAAAEALLAPPVRLLAPRSAPIRAAVTLPDEPAAGARGSVWIHGASMGEVVAARRWADTLARHGARLPFYVTTRTATGLERARAELGARAVARIAPIDGPRAVRAALSRMAPERLDIVETEIWPNWILAARAARVPVVFVSATVSARSERGLLRVGLARSGLLCDGVWVLAQSEADAERFRALGVPGARVAVAGDLKAAPPATEELPAPSRRRFVAFGSFRPGEEEAAVAAARALRDARPARGLIVAPRHARGVGRARAALGRSGFAVDVRDERRRSREPLDAWLDRLAMRPGERVGLLATRGELAAAYADAAIAIVGGTFAPYGGHNVLEPAARGCPVIVGKHLDGILPALEALTPEGALEVAPGPEALASLLSLWMANPGRLDAGGEGARRGAAVAARAAERAYDALCAFGLARGAGPGG